MTASVIRTGPHPPCPAPFNMAAYVLQAGRATPDKIALNVLSMTGAERWSYGRLTDAVEGAADGLRARGLQPGDRVLLRLGNSVAFPIAYLAAIAAGCIVVPTSAQLTAPEITRIATEVAPRLIIAEPEIALPDPPVPDLPVPVLRAAEMLALSAPNPDAFDHGDPNRPAYIVYTSGTSGVPRAVTHAHRAIWARRMMWDGWYGMDATDRVLHAGAFNWTYTLGTGLMDPWSLGATALIPGPGITPAQLPLLLKRHDATIFAAAPGVYRQMLRSEIAPLPRLRHGLSAGEKLADTLRTRWRDATGTPVHEAYGMSECSTFVSGSPTKPAPAGTLGRPQTGRHVAILGPDGPLPRGEVGTLAVASDDPGLMLGYWDRDLGGPAPLDGPWFRTGDQMSMDADDALHFHGRADDMMNAGGFRVSPIEVETVLTAHPEIAECAAIEQPVSTEASIIALYYVSDHDLKADDLAAFAAERLARYKQPRAYHRVAALPKGANGKLQRAVLRTTPPG